MPVRKASQVKKPKKALEKEAMLAALHNDIDEEVVVKKVPTARKKTVVKTREKGRAVGRPKTGKRSNPKYAQTTMYLTRDTLADIKRKLYGTGTDLSDLVEELIKRELKRR